MRIKEISYSRLFSLEGYENKKVGVIIEVQNDDPLEALEHAKEFVEKQSPEYEAEQKEAAYNEKHAQCVNIMANPKDYTIEQIATAAKLIKEHENLPF